MSNVRTIFQTSGASHAFEAPAPMNTAERVVLLVVVGGAMGTILLTAALGNSFTLAGLLDLGVTGLFAVFLVSPPIAVAMFAAAMVLAFLTGWDGSAFTALAVATGVVVRTGSARVIIVFAGLLLLSAAKIVMLRPSEPVLIEIGLLIAVVSGAAGLLMRSARGREQRLAATAREQASVMAELRRDERLLIADELHDVIAHDLTAIAMQARVVERQDDPALRAEIHREIGDAARRALRDVRRLIEPGHAEVSTGRIDDFETTLTDMVATLRTAGYSPAVSSNLSQPVPRMMDSALARVLRESTTNVLKHGRKGPVRIHVEADAQTISLQVRNRRGVTGLRNRLPSGGFGTTRLAERVGLLGGEFTQTIEGDEWVVRAALPLA
ncbi:sensor histidine kinase [Microbacterium maritypicum]|uniref:sensor histidine kinase n=1 Tax=Microbacterium maritypicum TaxID=33918 RepID=UPI00380F61EE